MDALLSMAESGPVATALSLSLLLSLCLFLLVFSPSLSIYLSLSLSRAPSLFIRLTVAFTDCQLPRKSTVDYPHAFLWTPCVGACRDLQYGRLFGMWFRMVPYLVY